ncbi:unnamed protein product [Pleuronectes platessa]|uniref:Uncharacterized protein n=1 Tax=Pleuronectes platessa TaxID=8262 RepID=A0A9N7VZ71_PLEPL|nr:unnamed protein product [Pleuronectes platessa]
MEPCHWTSRDRSCGREPERLSSSPPSGGEVPEELGSDACGCKPPQVTAPRRVPPPSAETRPAAPEGGVGGPRADQEPRETPWHDTDVMADTSLVTLRLSLNHQDTLSLPFVQSSFFIIPLSAHPYITSPPFILTSFILTSILLISIIPTHNPSSSSSLFPHPLIFFILIPILLIPTSSHLLPPHPYILSSSSSSSPSSSSPHPLIFFLLIPLIP